MLTVSRSRLVLATVLIGLTGWGVVSWALRAKHRNQTTHIDALIEELREPANKFQVVGYMVPGGELLSYSPPMKKLIALGDAARETLHRRLGEEQIQNEVVLILGAIGDESTVDLLVNAYPD